MEKTLVKSVFDCAIISLQNREYMPILHIICNEINKTENTNGEKYGVNIKSIKGKIYTKYKKNGLQKKKEFKKAPSIPAFVSSTVKGTSLWLTNHGLYDGQKRYPYQEYHSSYPFV